MCKRTPAMAVCNKKVNKSYPQAKHGYPQTAVDKMGYQQDAVDSVDNYMNTLSLHQWCKRVNGGWVGHG